MWQTINAGQVGYNFVAAGAVCGDGNYYASGTNLLDNVMLQAPLSGGSSPSQAKALTVKYNYFNLWCHPTDKSALLGLWLSLCFVSFLRLPPPLA